MSRIFSVTVIKTIADTFEVDENLLIANGIDLDDGEAITAFCEENQLADFSNPETISEVEFIVN